MVELHPHDPRFPYALMQRIPASEKGKDGALPVAGGPVVPREIAPDAVRLADLVKRELARAALKVRGASCECIVTHYAR